MAITETQYWVEAQMGEILNAYHAKLDEICARRPSPDEQHGEISALRWYLGHEQMRALNFHASAIVGFEYQDRNNRFKLMGIPIYIVSENSHLALVKT